MTEQQETWLDYLPVMAFCLVCVGLVVGGIFLLWATHRQTQAAIAAGLQQCRVESVTLWQRSCDKP